MKTEEEIIQELNNWVESKKDCNLEDNYEYIDLNDNLFTRDYERTDDPKFRINVYPEHLDLSGVGTDADNWLCNRINSAFGYDVEVLEKLGTSDQIKPYLNEENYLTLLTNEWYNKMITKQQKNEKERLKKHKNLEKLQGNVSKELYLKACKELFNKKQ